MDQDFPNSKRFWRLNSLSAIWMQMPLMPPADPEEQEFQRNLRSELQALKDREAAVMSRYSRRNLNLQTNGHDT